MASLIPQLKRYRLTTAEILYHFPDHPDLLQTYTWQDYDLAPEFPVLRRFLDFWRDSIEGRLHSVPGGLDPSHLRRRLSRQRRLFHAAIGARARGAGFARRLG